MKISFLVLLFILIGDLFGQSNIDGVLTGVPEIEFPFKISYEQLDTLTLSNYKTFTEEDMNSIVGDQRALRFGEEVNCKYYIPWVVNFEGTTSFIVITDAYSVEVGIEARQMALFIKDISVSDSLSNYFYVWGLSSIIKRDDGFAVSKSELVDNRVTTYEGFVDNMSAEFQLNEKSTINIKNGVVGW